MAQLLKCLPCKLNLSPQKTQKKKMKQATDTDFWTQHTHMDTNMHKHTERHIHTYTYTRVHTHTHKLYLMEERLASMDREGGGQALEKIGVKGPEGQQTKSAGPGAPAVCSS